MHCWSNFYRKWSTTTLMYVCTCMYYNSYNTHPAPGVSVSTENYAQSVITFCLGGGTILKTLGDY